VDEEVAAGRLIPELHRELANTLDLAPLRARVDDLSVLVPYFLQRQAEQAGRTIPILSDASLKRLKAYRWPGNLRELRNVLGSALAASPDPILEIGDHLLDNAIRIGSYTLIERLGSGGMGDVWLARHRLLARPAAVKIVREAALGAVEDGRSLRRRFAREAQATSELQSPHTVQLYDFGTTETGSFYYVVERLRGLDLQRMVERHGPLPPERTVFLLKQACLSLSEAHALGLVHRDIKPANLFVCRLGTQYDFVKVLDFGVVSRLGAEPIGSITVTGMVVGTPGFLAPELVSDRRSFDGRADIYALGCVAFWLLTGHPPFEGPDAMSVLMQHSSTAPLAPSARSEQTIPADLDALVLACLSKDMARRPSSADALWQRLDTLSVGRDWDPRRARTWWELHEPDLVGHN
jgi:serine/threonine-protein kinase